MKMTVLGCFGPYSPAFGACSGYLIQEGSYSLLLDCGNGVLSRLQEFIQIINLNAIIVSHLHADHFSDLLILRYALEKYYSQGLLTQPLPLYAPGAPEEEYLRLPYKNAYSVREINADCPLSLGPFTVFFTPSVHSVLSYAVKVEVDRCKLIYSGDTGYNETLKEFARNADIFLCEAGYIEEETAAGLDNHLNPTQAAEIARGASAKKLLLTHHNPERSCAAGLAAAKKFFPQSEHAYERLQLSI